MTDNRWLQIALFFACVLAFTKPMGLYLARVFERRRTWLDPILAPVELPLYKATAIRAGEAMRWTEYLVSILSFSAATLLLTLVVEPLQGHLLWNPQHLPGVAPDPAWNTAVSFTTNTNRQPFAIYFGAKQTVFVLISWLVCLIPTRRGE